MLRAVVPLLVCVVPLANALVQWAPARARATVRPYRSVMVATSELMQQEAEVSVIEDDVAPSEQQDWDSVADVGGTDAAMIAATSVIAGSTLVGAVKAAVTIGLLGPWVKLLGTMSMASVAMDPEMSKKSRARREAAAEEAEQRDLEEWLSACAGEHDPQWGLVAWGRQHKRTIAMSAMLGGALGAALPLQLWRRPLAALAGASARQAAILAAAALVSVPQLVGLGRGRQPPPSALRVGERMAQRQLRARSPRFSFN